MRALILICAAVLVAASVVTALFTTEATSKVPVLHWVSDPNPARIEQIAIFERWLKEKGYPSTELRLDTANNDTSKKIIQGVSGVGGDIMDMYGGGMLRYFQAVGLLSDVTQSAHELRFDSSYTFPAIGSEITIDGRQYAYPCNVATPLYWVNKAAFEKYGVPLPPRRWTFDAFERLGKEFVKKANPPGKRQTTFFASDVDRKIMRRSIGLSTFNETETRCMLDDPRNVEVLKLIRKWTYEDHILPTAADLASVSTAAGYGGSTLQLFNRGNFAMVYIGRYALIQLRQFGAMQLAVSEPPYGEFPNSLLFTRCAAIYRGSKHQNLARYFLAYLASKDYNMQIVEDADALPPNPLYTKTEAFLHPPKHPNEWGCHEVFAEAAQTIAIGDSYSPFILPSTVERIEGEGCAGFMSNVYSAEQAAKQMADRINAEIQRNLNENPNLRPLYDELVSRQQQIDRNRAAGRKVPLQWIDDPFYRRYYLAKGWAEKTGSD